MSEKTSNTTPSQLLEERFQWGCIYLGTKAELVAAGLVADGQFPGDPGRGKTMVTHQRSSHFGPITVVGLRYIKRAGKTRFRAYVDVCGDVQAWRHFAARGPESPIDSDALTRLIAASRADKTLQALLARATDEGCDDPVTTAQLNQQDVLVVKATRADSPLRLQKVIVFQLGNHSHDFVRSIAIDCRDMGTSEFQAWCELAEQDEWSLAPLCPPGIHFAIIAPEDASTETLVDHCHRLAGSGLVCLWFEAGEYDEALAWCARRMPPA